MSRDPAQPKVVKSGQAPPPCTLVIFGASGDLTRRKLVPALYSLHRDGVLPENLAVVGFGRSPMSDDAFRRRLREACSQFARRPVETEAGERFAPRLSYCAGDLNAIHNDDTLRKALQRADSRHNTGGNRLFYLAIPPSLYPTVLRHLGAAGLVSRDQQRPFARVVVEKPFGHDLESALALNATALQVLREDPIYRIDHYLGKEAVQNILIFRFGNAVWEPLWNRKDIDQVQITAAESIGVEGRGDFYEQAGVLRDIVQNHLLQVRSLVAMEPPISFDADAIREQKAQVLRCLRPLGEREVQRLTVRGQYGPGEVEGKPVAGYRQEKGVAPDSQVPTFVAMKLFIDNWRWQGVPLYLRAGKRLARRVTEVSIHFQQVPLRLFGEACPEANVLTFRIQPDEGIALRFAVKVPGEAMRGDATLFARADEVEAAWRFVTPILKAWQKLPPPELPNYFPGRWCPPEAEQLLTRNGRAWRNP